MVEHIHQHYPPTIDALQPGEHSCWIYATEEERRAMIGGFIERGLQAQQKVIYIVDARAPEEALADLHDLRLDVDARYARGQLRILTAETTYLQGCGRFDPDAMIALLAAETQQALAEGYTALRVTGEMSWALHNNPGAERLMEYEAKLNEFLPSSACLALCQYDARRFAPDVLLQVLQTHPFAVIGTEIYDNFYYVPPDAFLGPDLANSIYQNWRHNLAARKMLETALQASEYKYRTLFDNAGDAIFIHDLAGRFLEVNAVACEWLGYTREELLRMTPADIDTPDHADQVPERLRRIQAQGHIVFESLHRRKDGTLIPVEVNSRMINYDGQSAALSIARDITERKQAEAKRIAQLEQELRALELLSSTASAPVTMHVFGQHPLYKAMPEIFETLIQHYTAAMEMALEQRIYKIAHPLSKTLHQMAERLGFLKAGPRDVIDIHTTALKKKRAAVNAQKAEAYTDEARLLSLELMGHLVTYYRNRCGMAVPGVKPPTHHDDKEA